MPEMHASMGAATLACVAMLDGVHGTVGTCMRVCCVLPCRRMYNEHSFPKSSWMGAWKATHIILLVAVVWSVLWASHTMLSKCKALGSWHRRFHQLAPGVDKKATAVHLSHVLGLVLPCAAVYCSGHPWWQLLLALSSCDVQVFPAAVDEVHAFVQLALFPINGPSKGVQSCTCLPQLLGNLPCARLN